jgi:hypothetical protein
VESEWKNKVCSVSVHVNSVRRDEDHININVTLHAVCTFCKPQIDLKYICNAKYFDNYSTAYFHSCSTITEIKSKTGRWTRHKISLWGTRISCKVLVVKPHTHKLDKYSTNNQWINENWIGALIKYRTAYQEVILKLDQLPTIWLLSYLVIFYLRMTSVNWCGKVTINGNMYWDQILEHGSFRCSFIVYKPCINEVFKSLYFPTIKPYFIVETCSVVFLLLSRPHISWKTSQCKKKLLSWYINSFTSIMTLQFLIL